MVGVVEQRPGEVQRAKQYGRGIIGPVRSVVGYFASKVYSICHSLVEVGNLTVDSCGL